MTKPECLYHFTCLHSRRDIGSYGLLIPQIRHPFLGCKVTWLTTEAEPNRQATGLGNNTGLRCDRCQRVRLLYYVTPESPGQAWCRACLAAFGHDHCHHV